MLIDSFLFYTEPVLARMRLEYYADVIDRFVIVEADRSFTMQPHPAEFDAVYRDLPGHIRRKITYDYIEIDPTPVQDADGKSQGRHVEREARQHSHRLIRDIATQGILAMNDVDEFWDRRMLSEAMRMIDRAGKMCWRQEYRVCFIDWVGRLQGWPGSKMGRIEELPDDIMEFYCSKNKSWGVFSEILTGGWHLTIMGDESSKARQISAKREGPGWEQKIGKTSHEISSTVFANGWNTVVKKSKMRADKLGVENLDPDLVNIAQQHPVLWSGEIHP
jgi:hypothetical protein